MQANDNLPAPKPVATFQFCDAIFESLRPMPVEAAMTLADMQDAYMAEMRAKRLGL